MGEIIMTRQEAIERWADIASTVFWAEENISEEWYERLKSAHTMTKEEQHELADQYCKAIAAEIVNSATDEELARWD